MTKAGQNGEGARSSAPFLILAWAGLAGAAGVALAAVAAHKVESPALATAATMLTVHATAAVGIVGVAMHVPREKLWQAAAVLMLAAASLFSGDIALHTPRRYTCVSACRSDGRQPADSELADRSRPCNRELAYEGLSGKPAQCEPIFSISICPKAPSHFTPFNRAIRRACWSCARSTRADNADLTDKIVSDLPSLLQPGDALVFNDTRVDPGGTFRHPMSGRDAGESRFQPDEARQR